MIKLIRSDDRLIHGQCVTQIVKLYAIQHILVIDDFTATNPFLKRIFEKAVPSNITAEALTFDQAISAARKAVDNEVSTLILMKTPLVMQRLLEAVEDLPKDLVSGSYNPWRHIPEEKREETSLQVLNMMMSECSLAFERLPIIENTGILRNILYSGVWNKYKQIKENQRNDV